MKQIKIVLALLCFVLVAAGCNKDLETEVSSTTDLASLIRIGNFPAFDEGAQTRSIDPGKTEWDGGDIIYLTLQLKKDGSNFGEKQYFTLTYTKPQITAGTWKWNTSPNSDYRADSIAITATYAPNYELSNNELKLKDGKMAGTDEYLTYNASVPLTGGIAIDFSKAKNYSRLRVITDNIASTVKFTPTSGTFIPAGSSEPLTGTLTTTATYINAYFYGTWTAGSNFNFIIEGIEKGFNVQTTKDSEDGQSYAVDFTPPPLE